MSLETKSLAELEELASNLRSQIMCNPHHTTMEKVELKDVQDWTEQRRKEAKPGSRSNDDVTF
jgi:hypothetical protein